MTNTNRAQTRERLRGDDIAGLFTTLESGVGGRIVRLGASLDNILGKHKMSEAASRALAEVLTLAALLGISLPEEGQLIVQAQTDGSVPVIVADISANGAIRGYANDTAGSSDSANGTLSISKVRPHQHCLGNGRLAMTLRAEDGTPPYQSIVGLTSGVALQDAVAQYFADREGVATLLRLAVTQATVRKADGGVSTMWRSGGLMLQQPFAHDGEAAGQRRAEDLWDQARILAETVDDHELVDPTLTLDRLLLRLFHEEGVQVTEVRDVHSACRCSRDRLGNVLKTFAGDGLEDLREPDGTIVVTCEFCTRAYRFARHEL